MFSSALPRSIQPESGSATPSGLAIFDFRQNNILVSEASVQAVSLRQTGRIYAEVAGAVNTGIAVANPSNQLATLSFFFTDSTGTFGNRTVTIAARGQIAAFLDQAPFNSSSLLRGTFTFSSSVPIAVVALRGFTNERGEFLVTTLPVSDLNPSATTSGTIVLPSFADGGGWTSQIVLVNPGDTVLTGTVQFLDQSGRGTSVAVNGQTSGSFPYTLAARSSLKLQTDGRASSILTGSVRVIAAANSPTPSGFTIFSFRNTGITVSEAGVPAVPLGTAFRLYAENLTGPGSIQTGVAIVNPSASDIIVKLEVRALDGSLTGVTGSLQIPGNGQRQAFLAQITNLFSLYPPQNPFRGLLRISSPTPISVVGLRGRYNERGDFLITTIPSVDEQSTPSVAPLFSPHIVDSGGYTTQFVLFSGQPSQSSSGTMQLYSQSGGVLNLMLQ